MASGTPEKIKRGFGAASVTEATVRRNELGLLDTVRAMAGVEFAELMPDGVFFKLRIFLSDGMLTMPDVHRVAGDGNLDDVLQRGRTLEEAYVAILR